MKEDRHVPLLDAGIRWANALLERNEVLIRSMVHERSGSILRWTGLDETIANKIIDALDRLLGETADDSGQPLRPKNQDTLAALAVHLPHDPRTRKGVFQFKAKIPT